MWWLFFLVSSSCPSAWSVHVLGLLRASKTKRVIVGIVVQYRILGCVAGLLHYWNHLCCWRAAHWLSQEDPLACCVVLCFLASFAPVSSTYQPILFALECTGKEIEVEWRWDSGFGWKILLVPVGRSSVQSRLFHCARPNRPVRQHQSVTRILHHLGVSSAAADHRQATACRLESGFLPLVSCETGFPGRRKS